MREHSKRVTREELYVAVWSKPARLVATELGISDVALAKICRKLKIPKPGLGYWRRIETGSKLKRPPLPPLPPHGVDFVDINPALHGSKRTLPNGSNPAANYSEDLAQLIPQSLDRAHPAILKAKQWIDRGVRMDSYGLQAPSGEPVLAVRVGRSCSDRALRFLAGLVSALHQKGLGLVRHQLANVLGFGAGEDSLHFTLSEHTPRDKSASKRTGLALKLEVDRCDFNGAERSWMDCRRYCLEDRLGEIVEWISAGIEVVKKQRLIREAEEKRFLEEQRKRQEIEQAKALEEKRRANLLNHAEMWQCATLLRSFFNACESEIKSFQGQTLSSIKWLEWARAHADRIDPLKNGFVQKEVSRFCGLPSTYPDI